MDDRTTARSLHAEPVFPSHDARADVRLRPIWASGLYRLYGDAILADKPEIQPGECDVSSGEVIVGPGDYARTSDPECAQDLDELVKQIKPYFDQAASAALEDSVGPAGKIAYEKLGGNVARELARVMSPRSSCVLLSVKLPDGASAKSAIFYIWGQLDSKPPSPAGYRRKSLNDIGDWSKFESLKVAETDNGPIVTAVAKNWSDNTPRHVVMHVVHIPESVQKEKERGVGSCTAPSFKGCAP